MDTLTAAARSRNMSRIKSTGTKPEMIVRRTAHGLGFRYRLHHPGLPGKPDLVFARLRCIVFVHGCFWHCHDNCKLAHAPASRLEYWGPKLERNKQRDSQHQSKLKSLGWKVLVVWECETRNVNRLTGTLLSFLAAPKSSPPI